MKTLSVKQVADVLGVSPRAVLKRLSNGQLKGTRRTNKYGVEEWWVYPNKEIRSTLEASGRIDILGGNEALSDAEVVEVDSQSFAPDDDGPDKEVSPREVNSGAWADDARASTNGVAEELWNNIISRFLGELKERDQLIGEMRTELADKERQLKLLPDLKKMAEEERKAAELQALEATALKKQIVAMQAQQEEAATAKQKIDELERTMEQLRATEEEKLEQLKAEKEAHEMAIQKQLAAVTEELQHMRKPWWKKMFSMSETAAPAK
jgi:hypothetical protein